MNLTPRTSRLAAALIGSALVVALAGIAVDTSLFGAPGKLTAALDRMEPTGAGTHVDEADVSAEPPDARAGLGTEFEVQAPGGGVTATADDTQVIVATSGRPAVTVNLNDGQTYVFAGSRTVLVSDKPVVAFAGRDKPVQPIR